MSHSVHYDLRKDSSPRKVDFSASIKCFRIRGLVYHITSHLSEECDKLLHIRLLACRQEFHQPLVCSCICGPVCGWQVEVPTTTLGLLAPFTSYTAELLDFAIAKAYFLELLRLSSTPPPCL